MSTDAQVAVEPAPEQPSDDVPAPNWWHRDHPMFTSLIGFYAGLVCSIVVPGVYAGVLGAFYDQHTVTKNFPYLLVGLVIPLVLLIPRRTRRFGIFFWIGTLSTLVVVLGVAALVLWLLISRG